MEYGPQSKFGYKSFNPKFTMAKFNPKAWTALFKRAGARAVVPIAEHCDGFPEYDSQFTLWDAARMGPKQELVAELEKAVRADGMRFGVSSHRAEHWWWNNPGTKFQSDIDYPRYAGLHGPAEPMNLPGVRSRGEPNLNQLQDWLARSTELVEKFHPDLIYFDWWINQPAFAPYLKKMAAYYYNAAAARHQGVVLTYKLHAIPRGAAVQEVAFGKRHYLSLRPWQADISVSRDSWGYVRRYRTARSLLTDLIDIVSKNGDMLLNIGPRANGTIPARVRRILLRMGAWLRVNGQAIYGTRPWVLYGAVPTVGSPGSGPGSPRSYTSRDIRFTHEHCVLHALGLDRPGSGKVLIRVLYAATPYLHGPITRISLLGDAAPIHWRQTHDGPAVQLPLSKSAMRYALKILNRGATRHRH